MGRYHHAHPGHGRTSEPFMHEGARALADLLPHAELRILGGRAHAVDAAALAPVLTEFFARA